MRSDSRQDIGTRVKVGGALENVRGTATERDESKGGIAWSRRFVLGAGVGVTLSEAEGEAMIVGEGEAAGVGRGVALWLGEGEAEGVGSGVELWLGEVEGVGVFPPPKPERGILLAGLKDIPIERTSKKAPNKPAKPFLNFVLLAVYHPQITL